MKVIKKPITDINLAEYNPRIALKPGNPTYEKIKRSITEFSLVEPLIWNERTGNLVGGHQRLRVLQELGYTEVDVSVINLDEKAEKALNLSLNKINGTWDRDKLQNLISELETDIEITGFDVEEAEKILKESIPHDIDEILEELDIDKAIEKPLWAVIRASDKVQSELSQLVKLAEDKGFKVETSYDR